jgi:hypothetical protein
MAEVQKDLEIAFNLRYRARVNKVVQEVRASVNKYDISENIGQVEDSGKGRSIVEKARADACNATQQPEVEFKEKQDDYSEIKKKKQSHWWKLEWLHFILSIIFSVFSLLASTGVPQNRESVWKDMDKF